METEPLLFMSCVVFHFHEVDIKLYKRKFNERSPAFLQKCNLFLLWTPKFVFVTVAVLSKYQQLMTCQLSLWRPSWTQHQELHKKWRPYCRSFMQWQMWISASIWTLASICQRCLWPGNHVTLWTYWDKKQRLYHWGKVFIWGFKKDLVLIIREKHLNIKILGFLNCYRK